MERSRVRRRPKAVAAALALAVVAGLSLTAAPAPADELCGGGSVTDFRYGAPVCIHFSEKPPAGVDAKDRPSTLELEIRRFGEPQALASELATESGTGGGNGPGGLACLGDGTDGTRVQAIYAHASDVADRFASVAGLIAAYAADADYQINVSAGLSGAGRRIRYVTDAGCALNIARVTLSPSGDDGFSSMRSELRSQGFTRTDRKYLVWVDAAVGICGLGEMYGDDQAGSSNLNNRGPSYARVDAPCWDYAEAHELIHTLGGVQDSAPNSSGAGHCLDENDTMCYRDSSGLATSVVCASLPSWHVDCNLDDYFNASPPAGSYLATHWNVANSIYLEGAEAPPVAPSISISAPSSITAGTSVGVSASAAVPAGRTYEITWTTSRGDCTFASATGATNVYSCPSAATGSGEISATVHDSLGMSSSATKVFSLIPQRQRASKLGLGASATRVRRGAPLTLKGKLADRATGSPAGGVPVVVYGRRSGSSRWVKLGTAVTGPDGTIAWVVRLSRTMSFKLVSATTPAWTSSQSSIKRVSVR